MACALIGNFMEERLPLFDIRGWGAKNEQSMEKKGVENVQKEGNFFKVGERGKENSLQVVCCVCKFRKLLGSRS